MGTPKYIESPEKLMEYFREYVIHVKSNPIKVKDWVGKDGDAVYREKERPLTLEGFENYLYTNEIISDISNYFEGKLESYKDYLPISRAIKRMIRQDQIEGGMSGIYNPSITQRLNNLVEKVQEDGHKQVTIKVKYERRGDTNYIESGAPSAGESIEGAEEV